MSDHVPLAEQMEDSEQGAQRVIHFKIQSANNEVPAGHEGHGTGVMMDAERTVVNKRSVESTTAEFGEVRAVLPLNSK